MTTHNAVTCLASIDGYAINVLSDSEVAEETHTGHLLHSVNSFFPSTGTVGVLHIARAAASFMFEESTKDIFS